MDWQGEIRTNDFVFENLLRFPHFVLGNMQILRDDSELSVDVFKFDMA